VHTSASRSQGRRSKKLDALLDAQAGVEWEGEQPQATDNELAAFKVRAMLNNGMGGLDWAGLPLACAYHGVRDVEGLLHRLYVMQTHRDPKES
jgi:hypothetical protein